MKTDDQLRSAAEIIYRKFEPLLDKPEQNPRTYIPAVEFFDMLNGVVSKPTIYRAKELLGIHSDKIAGRWVWRLPKRSADKAMQSIHRVRLDSIGKEVENSRLGEKRLWRKSVQYMREEMTAAHYDALAVYIVKAFKESGFTKRTASRAKLELGIISLKRIDGWHWVWGAPEVVDWLEEQFNDVPIPIVEIFARAKQNKWSEDVVRIARRELGGIKDCWVGEPRKHCWYDMNKSSVGE